LSRSGKGLRDTGIQLTPPYAVAIRDWTPADYFGRTLIANLPEKIRVGVINVSVGGCKIELFDKDNYQAYVSTAPKWMLGMINEYDGNPYARLVEMAKLAQKDGVIRESCFTRASQIPGILSGLQKLSWFMII